jgi:hypothetical protein
MTLGPHYGHAANVQIHICTLVDSKFLQVHHDQAVNVDIMRQNNFCLLSKHLVEFEVLMAVSMKMAVFWVVALCSLEEIYCFRGPCCLHHTLMMEAAKTSEMLVNFYQTTQCYNPQDSHIRKHFFERKIP